MLTLINTNRMTPPIAPVGVDYVAGAVRRAGIDVEVLDLGLAEDPHAAMAQHFARHQPQLVGLSLRNVDDCFWPSGASFLPGLCDTVAALRTLTAAPIVLGGVGFSIFARRVVEQTSADFGIRGDGETSLVALLQALRAGRGFGRVEGLIWRDRATIRVNPPAWPARLDVPTERDAVDNAAYFRRGGQIGVETKRGCCRQCVYCADPLAKGPAARVREPAEVADEVEALLGQGIDVLHLCDCEFNIPPDHARAVCDEFIRRRLRQRVRWYTYMAVTPFDGDLARRMAAAGCVGINFTGDAAAQAMLTCYGQPHRPEDLAHAVRLCKEHGMAVMVDLLLGGPGETPQTLSETIHFVRRLAPDCAGAALGIRVYPNTAMERLVAAEGPWHSNLNLRHHYEGPVDLLKPTFYIAAALGEHAARLVRKLIDGDPRFFEPADETPGIGTDRQGDHNYNENRELVEAIASGARGAYWDILRKLRT
ncbi:MAG: cobalamin-dependent protein [Pirellulales bacterium]|nr:cobalamin-dependent protein [Pirellulales bacterium]